jgi:ferredoxin
MSKTVRRIVRIDEEKCNGCGACVPKCAEGALQIVGGKARLVTEVYCDGLGACLGECPRGAITIEERGAEEFDEDAAQRHAERSSRSQAPAAAQPATCCPVVEPVKGARAVHGPAGDLSPLPPLPNFPIQLGLVGPGAPFLRDAHVLLAADCAGYLFPGLRRLLDGHVLIIACPKLDDSEVHLEKLTAILKQSTVKSITVVRTEVPCCAGLVRLAEAAAAASGRDVPVDVVVVGIDGEVKQP